MVWYPVQDNALDNALDDKLGGNATKKDTPKDNVPKADVRSVQTIRSIYSVDCKIVLLSVIYC